MASVFSHSSDLWVLPFCVTKLISNHWPLLCADRNHRPRSVSQPYYRCWSDCGVFLSYLNVIFRKGDYYKDGGRSEVKVLEGRLSNVTRRACVQPCAGFCFPDAFSAKRLLNNANTIAKLTPLIRFDDERQICSFIIILSIQSHLGIPPTWFFSFNVHKISFSLFWQHWMM